MSCRIVLVCVGAGGYSAVVKVFYQPASSNDDAMINFVDIMACYCNVALGGESCPTVS